MGMSVKWRLRASIACNQHEVVQKEVCSPFEPTAERENETGFNSENERAAGRNAATSTTEVFIFGLHEIKSSCLRFRFSAFPLDFAKTINRPNLDAVYSGEATRQRPDRGMLLRAT
jgi:hypothetical protein